MRDFFLKKWLFYQIILLNFDALNQIIKKVQDNFSGRFLKFLSKDK